MGNESLEIKVDQEHVQNLLNELQKMNDFLGNDMIETGDEASLVINNMKGEFVKKFNEFFKYTFTCLAGLDANIFKARQNLLSATEGLYDLDLNISKDIESN